MKATIIWSVVVVIVAVAAFLGGKALSQPHLAGAIGNNYIERYSSEILYNGGYNSQLPIQTSSTITGVGFTNTGDMTVSGGTLTVTTSNTATSTLSVGCVQTYATSTATAIQLQYGIDPNATTTYSGTSNGLVAWKYGTCPNL